LAGPKPLRGREPLSDRWIRWVLLRHRVILLAAVVLTLIAGVFATRLQVNGDLRVLLPTNHPVVRGLEQIEATFGSINTVNIVAKQGTPEARHAFTDALEARLEGHRLFREVEHGLPTEFFAERALYYLTDDELLELEQRVDAWTHYQLCSKTPDACLTAPDPAAPDRLREFIEDKRDRSHERAGFSGRYEREGIEAEVMLVHPYEPANRLEVAQEVTLEIRALAQEVYEQPDAPWAGTDMTYNIIGPYVTKADEQATIKRDMLRSGIFAFLGVVVILYVLFRSNRAVLVLLVPLMFGVIWSLGATWLVLGHLNVMTSTISTVVMGLGIDAGIHFLTRARRARLEHDDGEAIRRAFDGLVIPLLVASSTTIGAFLCMASSDFPPFREFGLISAMGVALCLVNMVAVLPALCFLVGIKKRGEPPPPREEPGWAVRLVLARPGLLFVGTVVVSLALTLGVREVDFEYNGRSLQSDHARRNTEPDAKLVSSVFGKDIHASVLVRPTLEEARTTLALARERHAARVAAGDTVVAELFGAPDLLPDPALDLQTRARWIAGFRGDHAELLDELRERAGLPPRERPTQATRDDTADWDDWNDDEGVPTPAPEPPAEPGQMGDEWDDWDGSQDEPGPTPGAAEGAPVPEPTPSEPKPEKAGAAAPEPTPSEPRPEKAGAAAPEPTPAEPAPAPAPSDEPEELSKADAELLLAMFDAEPFTIDDLPQALLSRVRASDGSYGLFAYPAFDVADMKKGIVFMDETTSYLDDPEKGIFVGEAVVYAAMYLTLREEAPAVLLMAALIIAVLVYWQLRSIPWMLLTLVPLALAMWWMLGVMGTIDLRFTLFNLPILPAILGIGVDNGVYLTDKIRQSSTAAELSDALEETGHAILAATATTAVGFAAFLVADSGAVRSIGSIAVLGISIAAFTALLVLPIVSELMKRYRRRPR
jgi:predicted RND superfamily exporter protein